MNNFWSKFSSRKDLSGHSLMNLETDSERSLLKFKEEKKHLSKVLDLSKFNNLLDLGGGIGIWSDFFLKNDLQVSLVEKELNFIDQARSSIESKNISFHQCDVNDFNFKKNSFDIIFISGVTIYLDDLMLDDLVKKMNYALKPGGILIHRDAYSMKTRLVINKFSKELNTNYFATYRTLKEYNNLIVNKHYFKVLYSEDMYKFCEKLNKRKETKLRLNIYKK